MTIYLYGMQGKFCAETGLVSRACDIDLSEGMTAGQMASSSSLRLSLVWGPIQIKCKSETKGPAAAIRRRFHLVR